MRFDAVIFDLYGTLVDNGVAPGPKREAYRHTNAAIAKALGTPADGFVQLWDDTGDSRITGVFPTFEAYVTALCAQMGIAPGFAQLAEALRLRMELSRSLLVPRADCVETLIKLQAKGLKVGLITDCSWETVVLWPETPFPPLFDATVFSSTVGLQKPAAEIFALACSQLGVSPDRCLFVGDGGSDELAGAERVGMTALRIHVPYETPPDAANPWPGPEVSALAQVLDWLD